MGKKGGSSPFLSAFCPLSPKGSMEEVKQTQVMTSGDTLVARTPFIGLFY